VLLVERRRYLIVVSRPLSAAPNALRRRYLIVLPRPPPRLLECGAQTDSHGAAQVLGRGAQAVARGAACCASQILDHGSKTFARGAARCLSQVLNSGAQAVARGAARCLSEVLDRDARVVACGAATLLQQEKNNSVDVQRNRLNITGFICTVVRYPLRRCTFYELESLAVVSRRR